MRPILILLSLLYAAAVFAASDVADAVGAAAPGTVFLPGEPLEFKLKSHATLPAKWTLKNWKSEVIRTGDWPVKGPLTLAALPNGYYKLELAGDSAEFTGFRSFAVVSDPAKRPANPDMFFAMDSAQSWTARPDPKNPRQPENSYEVVSEVARRAGLQMVRERLSWNGTEPAPGQLNWAQYKANADLLAARGIQILGMYHDAPKWAKGNTDFLPGDLVAAYNFAKKAAETFRGRMTVWEFWNEQNIRNSHLEAAWDYAAALKAASLGFKAGDPVLPVAIGGYYTDYTSGFSYADAVMASGAGEYFDIFNIHSYRSISGFPALLTETRAHMKRHGIEERPIWVTENGSETDGWGRLESGIPGIKMHSPDQEMLIAEYIPKMMISMQFHGVARDFFFVLTPYNNRKGNKDWGLMRRDFTVKPGFVAFSTLTDKLGDAVPAGEVDLGRALKGYLYRQKDGGMTLVYWSISPLDAGSRPNLDGEDRPERTFTLPKQKGVLRGVDLFGTPFETDGRQVTATRFPSFLDGVTGLKVAVPFKARKTSGAPENPAIDKAIIFRTELSPDFIMHMDGDSVDVKKDDAKLKLQVWNLSDRSKTGVVSAIGGKVRGLPESVLVPAFGKTELELGFTPEISKKDFKGEFRVTGDFGGRKTTPLVIPVQSMKSMVDSGRKVEMPQMLVPANWRKNASGKTTIGYDAAEKAISFRTVFPPGADRWTYPEYVLQLPRESLKGALGIGFEVKVTKASAVNQMLVMAVAGKQKEVGRASNLVVKKPTEQWEGRFVRFPSGFDPARVEQFRIGINALADDVTVLLRNIRIIYAP